jgi:murein DD-endopeptidase MepM/ murein hydrolase activator NlpD
MIALSWPVYREAPVTQRYAENPGSYSGACTADGSHNGIDWGIPEGTAIYATADGTVLRADLDPTGYGLHVRIQHDGLMSLYGHLRSVAVVPGQHVTAGQVIGESGNTGNSSGPHLHFEVRRVADNCKSTVDPWFYLVNAASAKFHGIVTDEGDGLRVRVEPNIKATVRQYLPKGMPIDLLEIQGDWGRLLDAGERWVCLRLNGVEFVHITNWPGQPGPSAQLSDHEMVVRLWNAHPEVH